MEITVSSSFFPLLDDGKRYLVLCGGAGSGKTEFAARKIFFRCLRDGGHRFLILRKVRSRVRESVLEVMLRLIVENDVPHEFNKTERTIAFASPNGKMNELLFDGLDDPEKIKSIKGLTGIWIEEATEFTKDEFLQLDLRLREPGPDYHQIILSFNPDEAQAPWLKEMFFDHKHPDATVHVSTVADNPIQAVRDNYAARLEKLREHNDTMYAIYGLGRWAQAKGKIYDWDVVTLPRLSFDETFYGCDFGYSVDPAAVVRVHRKADEFWVQELIYTPGLTNIALGAVMRQHGLDKGRPPIYCDSAEPKSIQELYEMGFNVKPSEKGPDSVRSGIDYIKGRKVHIVEGSEHIIIESRKYAWRLDKLGRPIPDPVKSDDHMMDAIRYAIVTHCKVGHNAGAFDSEVEIY